MLERKFTSASDLTWVIIEFIICGLWIYAAILILPDVISQFSQQEAYESQAFRVVANSNTEKDQLLKEQIVASITSNEEKLDATQIEKWMENYYPNIEYEISNGSTLLPPKWVDSKFYPQGYYEAVVLKLGDGRGNNWFCALFYKACGHESKKKLGSSVSIFKKWWKKV